MLAVFVERVSLVGFFFPFCCLCTGIPRAVIYRNSNMKGTLQGIISI